MSVDEITHVKVDGNRVRALSSGLSMNMYDSECSAWSQNEYFLIAVANLIRHFRRCKSEADCSFLE